MKEGAGLSLAGDPHSFLKQSQLTQIKCNPNAQALVPNPPLLKTQLWATHPKSLKINHLTFSAPPLLLCHEAPPEYKHQDPGEELDQGGQGEAALTMLAAWHST